MYYFIFIFFVFHICGRVKNGVSGGVYLTYCTEMAFFIFIFSGELLRWVLSYFVLGGSFDIPRGERGGLYKSLVRDAVLLWAVKSCALWLILTWSVQVGPWKYARTLIFSIYCFDRCAGFNIMGLYGGMGMGGDM